MIRGEEPVGRVVIGRLRLVVASDLLEAVAPPLVYAGPRVRGRRASSLKTASFVAFTPRREGEVRLDRTNRESRVGRGYQLKHNERALLHRETEHGHGSRFDEPPRALWSMGVLHRPSARKVAIFDRNSNESELDIFDLIVRRVTRSMLLAYRALVIYRVTRSSRIMIGERQR